MAQIFFNIKSVFWIGIRQVFVLRVPGYIILVAEEWTDALHLQDALAAIHHRQLIG